MLTSYICIDLETSGLNPKRDKIIEIGAVKVVEGVETDSFSVLVNPGRRLDSRIVELTGIRNEDLYKASGINEIFEELVGFMEEYPILGHSILSDYSFLKKAAVDLGLVFEKSAVDTLKLARKYLPELESRRLEALCRHFQIPHNPHRALEDARATVELYRILCDKYYESGEALFTPVPLHFKVKKDQPASLRQKQKLYELLTRFEVDEDMEIESLSRSEASRLTDRLLSRYGMVKG